jgi:hypothetical protein
MYLYIFLIKNIHKVLKYGSINYEKRLIRGVIGSFLYFANFRDTMNRWSQFVGVLVGILSKHQFMVIGRINIVGNKQVSSQFIAYFIGKKLRLGYPMRSLVSSLSNEFSRLRSFKGKDKGSVVTRGVGGKMIFLKKRFLGYYNLVKLHYIKMTKNDYLNNDTWWYLDNLMYISNLKNFGFKYNYKLLKHL